MADFESKGELADVCAPNRMTMLVFGPECDYLIFIGQ